jgi:hypothetical protein
MKKAIRQKFPPGWNEKKVRDVIAYYDNQSEDEGAAEIEAAPEAAGETWMSVPTELVPTIARLIEGYTHNAHARQRSAAKARPKKSPRLVRR